MTRNKGFTLIELLVYIAIFAIVAGILSTIFYIVINSQKKQSISGEVTQQLNFVLGTVQRLVGDSSLVEAAYEGQDASSTCATFCTLKLRRTDPAKDPTIITSNANGIYLQEGSSAQVALTNSKVVINNLKFTKNEIPTKTPTTATTEGAAAVIATASAVTTASGDKIEVEFYTPEIWGDGS